MKQMKIAFVAQPTDCVHPPVQGGSLAIWIYQVSQICAESGCDTVVFSNHGPLCRYNSVTFQNVEFIYTSSGLNRVINKISGIARGLVARLSSATLRVPRFASKWKDFFYALEVGLMCRRMHCDVVYIVNYSQFVPIIRLVNPHSVVCLHMACEWLTQLNPEVIEKRLAYSDIVSGCSNYITNKIATRYPQFSERCMTIHNGATLTKKYNTETTEPGFVLFVGRISPEKGVHDLVTAFLTVLKRFPTASLHMVGGVGSIPMELLVGLSDEPHVSSLSVFYDQNRKEGKNSYLAYLENEAGSELSNRIFFEGRIQHSQVGVYYRRAAVLVNPSLSEAFGMSLVEAMMYQVPVVATRVGGMTDIVDDNQTGILVDPADPTALANGICTILENPACAYKMGIAGWKKATEKFSWNKITGDLLNKMSEFYA